tara:strand:- start:888 stop:2216 length:1329 start_codon:yes stop_codon:yes gene_type:complete
LFTFLKYVQPTHYFSRKRKDGTFIFPKKEALPKEIIEQVLTDNRYSSTLATNYDISWQAVNMGYVGKGENYAHFKKIPLEDEYVFLRTYFNPVWSIYVVLIRILTFKNPFKEISAWLGSRNVKRSTYLQNPIPCPDWPSYKSVLVEKTPLVSIIIPTLNRYRYLKDVLEDLEKQTYTNFEVIVVDQSEPFKKQFYDDFSLNLNVIYQEEKALWLARNTAVEISKGSYILLFDDDSRVGPDWIIEHLKCIDFFNAEISSGVSISTLGAEVPKNYSFFRISDQIDTGNVLLKKEVFKTTGLFDRQFEKQRMGDGEFGLRCFLEGFRNISNPFAERLHLKVGSGGLRQMGSWDAFRTNKLFAPRPIPSVLYFYRRYYGNNRAMLALLKSVPPSIIPYRFKKNKILLLLGIFISILLLPFIAIQVWISWRRATKKINQGPLIRAFN